MPAPIRCHHIPVTSWRAMLVVIIGGTQDELVEAFRRYKLNPAEQTDLAVYCATQMRVKSAAHLQAPSRPRRQFIYFSSAPDLSKPHHAATVAHEALHATFAILRDSGIRLNEGSEEAYCYLHMHLVEQLTRKLSRR